ncbi:hypothetical protein BDZ97DRAFT_1814572 [Flammula alnicola]|nr:hypothetical protein BDZ97DRAFT_1814572 [Flammula alnicola]
MDPRFAHCTCKTVKQSKGVSSSSCLPTCQAVRAWQEMVSTLPPHKAVAEAAKVDPMSPLVNAVATKAGNPLYRRAGAPAMFVKHMLNSKPTDPDALDVPYWKNPVMGLGNTLAGILRENSEVQDAAILQELRAAYPRIIDVLWRDFALLKQPGSDGDESRISVSNMIRAFLKDRTFKRAVVEVKTITIVVQCWLETTPDSCSRAISRISTTDAMTVLFSSLNNPPPEYLDIAFKAFDTSYLISRVVSYLKDKNLSGTDLTQEVPLLSHFIVRKEPFLAPFVRGRVHKYLMAATLRHLKSSGQNPELIEQILEDAAIFTDRLTTSADDPVEMFTKLFSSTSGLKVTSKVPTQGHNGPIEPWFDIFERVWHCITCETPHGRCRYQATPAMMQAAKAAFERSQYRCCAGSRKYINLWSQIISKLGMTGASIRERHRLERKCCNIIKSTCALCQSVYYCDRACQKEDWKNHKEECKRMAAMAQ